MLIQVEVNSFFVSSPHAIFPGKPLLQKLIITKRYFSYLHDEVGKVAQAKYLLQAIPHNCNDEKNVRLFARATEALRELDLQTLPSPKTQICTCGEPWMPTSTSTLCLLKLTELRGTTNFSSGLYG